MELPEHLPNVHVLRRDNAGFEFCGQAEALRRFQSGDASVTDDDKGEGRKAARRSG